MAPGIVLKIEDRGSAIIEGSLERYLVKNITEIMLEVERLRFVDGCGY
jgi:hypothetical protein